MRSSFGLTLASTSSSLPLIQRRTISHRVTTCAFSPGILSTQGRSRAFRSDEVMCFDPNGGFGRAVGSLRLPLHVHGSPDAPRGEPLGHPGGANPRPETRPLLV